jgi:hypothetical protein
MDSVPGTRSWDWTDAEIAWPLAILAGFAGTLGGIWSGLPGMPALLATAAFLPLWGRLVVAGQRTLAFLLGLAWCLGAAGAAGGAVFELDGATRVAETLPFGARLVAWRLYALSGAGPSTSVLLALSLAAASGLALLALPLRGACALGAMAALAQVFGCGAALTSLEAGRAGRDPTLALVLGWPPSEVLALGASSAVVAALAGAGWERLGREQRRLLARGASVTLGAIALDPLLEPLWRMVLDPRSP